jgi:hypothetical protein
MIHAVIDKSIQIDWCEVKHLINIEQKSNEKSTVVVSDLDNKQKLKQIKRISSNGLQKSVAMSKANQASLSEIKQDHLF